MTGGIQELAGRLTDAERDRLIYGRLDWRDLEWQDHCGDLECDFCAGSLIPDAQPSRLPPEEALLRAHLLASMQEGARP